MVKICVQDLKSWINQPLWTPREMNKFMKAMLSYKTYDWYTLPTRQQVIKMQRTLRWIKSKIDKGIDYEYFNLNERKFRRRYNTCVGHSDELLEKIKYVKQEQGEDYINEGRYNG